MQGTKCRYHEQQRRREREIEIVKQCSELELKTSHSNTRTDMNRLLLPHNSSSANTGVSVNRRLVVGNRRWRTGCWNVAGGVGVRVFFPVVKVDDRLGCRTVFGIVRGCDEHDDCAVRDENYVLVGVIEGDQVGRRKRMKEDGAVPDGGLLKAKRKERKDGLRGDSR